MCSSIRLGINPNYYRLYDLTLYYEGVSTCSIPKFDRTIFLRSFAERYFPYGLETFNREFTEEEFDTISNSFQLSFNYQGKERLFPLFIKYKCGHCDECRFEKQNDITNRALLESSVSKFALFVTLTYDDENNDDLLHREHLRDYLRSLRSHLRKSKYDFLNNISFQYIACGEYGKTTNRPHYHILLLFDNYIPRNFFKSFLKILKNLWKYGYILDVQLCRNIAASSRYICKYIGKQSFIHGTEEFDEPDRPFMLLSRRPSLGCSPAVLSQYMDSILHSNDCTLSLRFDVGQRIRIPIPPCLIKKFFPQPSDIIKDCQLKLSVAHYLTECLLEDPFYKLTSSNDFDSKLNFLASQFKRYRHLSLPKRPTFQERFDLVTSHINSTFSQGDKFILLNKILSEFEKLSYDFLVCLVSDKIDYQNNRVPIPLTYRLNSMRSKIQRNIHFINSKLSDDL